MVAEEWKGIQFALNIEIIMRENRVNFLGNFLTEAVIIEGPFTTTQ